MEPYKLHVKVGNHEFSGEGSEDAVKRDFAEWKELIANAVESRSASQPDSTGDRISTDTLNKLFTVDNKLNIVTLRVLPRSQDTRDADALLLVLLGSKLIQDQDELAVGQLKLALQKSGCTIERVDQTAGKSLREGLLNKGGIGKGGRYSLTNSGILRAHTLANELAT